MEAKIQVSVQLSARFLVQSKCLTEAVCHCHHVKGSEKSCKKENHFLYSASPNLAAHRALQLSFCRAASPHQFRFSSDESSDCREQGPARTWASWFQAPGSLLLLHSHLPQAWSDNLGRKVARGARLPGLHISHWDSAVLVSSTDHRQLRV
jgi:hypothetical protein